MTIEVTDIVFRKSITVTDTGVNGGRKGRVAVVHAARHNLFPRVTLGERTAGVTRYRKEFWTNEDGDDESAFASLFFLEYPSNGGDRFALGKGTMDDTQGDIETTSPAWIGCGSLNSALSGGESAIDILMEADDFVFQPGGYLHIANKIQLSQTIGVGVSIGDSVQETTGTWNKIANTTDIEYPKGIYLGSNSVLSEKSGYTEEFLLLAENKTTDEDIGTGDGVSASPALTDLAAVTNGVFAYPGFEVSITTLDVGDNPMEVTIGPDGVCSGDCSAGELNMDTGVWITDITWSAVPKSAEDILATYYDKNYSYVGNVVTVDLAATVANPYATNNTIVSGVIEGDSEVAALVSDFTVNSVGGTYDDTSYPIVLRNDGVEEDTFTITFLTPTTFTVAGLYAGSLGTGDVATDLTPLNPDSGESYFELDSAGWGGSFLAGDTVVFGTSPAAVPLWWRQIVPAGTPAEPNNIAILGWYSE